MKQTDIKNLTSEDLVVVYTRIQTRMTKEVNRGNGRITQQTLKEQEWILQELGHRFDLDVAYMQDEITNS